MTPDTPTATPSPGPRIRAITKTLRDLSEERAALLVALRREGKTYRAMAKIAGIPHDQIHKLVKNVGGAPAGHYRQPSITGWACLTSSCRVRVYDIDADLDSRRCPLCGREGIRRTPWAV